MIAALLGQRPRWDIDGIDWPNREASRFVTVDGVRWHVQVMGSGPCLLLIHGTGASNHSWRDVMPRLAKDFTVVAPDLPGHGFTEMPGLTGLSLDAMARTLGRLLSKLELEPAVAVGHSAGAAIVIRATLDKVLAPAVLISFNGAVTPYGGSVHHLFSPLAKLLFLNPFAPRAFAWGANSRARVDRLIRQTGSRIDDRGIELYRRLLRRPGHVAGALGMMASWNLAGFGKEMMRLRTPLFLVVGEQDLAVPPKTTADLAAEIDTATFMEMTDAGHLAHEEQPDEAAVLVRRVAVEHGVLSDGTNATSERTDQTGG